MKRQSVLRHEFVEHVPDQLVDGIIYVSISFATVVHRCCCGCGREIVTPLSPTDWQLIFDGAAISLTPSIGNWSLPCRSHYWIVRNRVRWALPWSQREIDTGRAADALAKAHYFEDENQSRIAIDPIPLHPSSLPPTLHPIEAKSADTASGGSIQGSHSCDQKEGFWRRLKRKVWG
jgi:hypothetical protein